MMMTFEMKSVLRAAYSTSIIGGAQSKRILLGVKKACSEIAHVYSFMENTSGGAHKLGAHNRIEKEKCTWYVCGIIADITRRLL